MPARTPEERALIARIASGSRWARTADRSDATRRAREGLRNKFADEVDPDRCLPPEERERRVDHLMHAHMARMSLKAAQARRRGQQAAADQLEAESAIAELGDDTAGSSDHVE